MDLSRRMEGEMGGSSMVEVSENAINSTSNTSTYINGSRLHVSTLKGSSSGLLFKTSL